MNHRILLLPADPACAATCLIVDDDGRILSRTRVTADYPAPAAMDGRSVLVVPGAAVRIDRLALRAHSAAQARAAAQAMLAERLARPSPLHVALDPHATATTRLVAAVEPALLRDWLARAAALGLRPDAAVPEQLLLPAADEGEERVQVLDAGDRWLVRGPQLAFSAAPALAAQVLGERPRTLLQGGLDALAARALHPEIDLLQDGFAPASARRPQRTWRRLGWLVAALLASPLVLVAAQALRMELAARALESHAADSIREALPASTAGAGSEALARHLDAAREPRAFATASGALFAAVAAHPGMHLEELEYQRGDRLRAVLVHADAADLEALRGALAADGWGLVEGGTSQVPGGLRTGVALEPSA